MQFSFSFARLHIDVWLFLLLLVTASYGLLALYSASGGSEAMLIRQVIRLSVGLLMLLFAAQIDVKVLRRWAPMLYVPLLLLLLAVLLFGSTGKGAQRWLDIHIFRFQPSELMRIVMPIMCAWRLASSPVPPNMRAVFETLCLIALPFTLIALQPDLGTSLLIASSGFFVLFIAGLRWRTILVSLGACVISLPLLWRYVLHGYQKQRILTFLDPERDPLGAGYHIIQSKIAIGSGGFFGKGFLQGTQSQLEFLPERTTDFIFAVLAEEFGYVGVCVLFILYGLIVARGIYITIRAPNTFAYLLAASVTLTLFIYIFVNIGMVSGILPVVGMPLPLFSYGGTSMVTIMVSFGILMSIHTHK